MNLIKLKLGLLYKTITILRLKYRNMHRITNIINDA